MDYSITDLEPTDTTAIDDIAALLLRAFVGWHTTLDEARDEVRESFQPGRISLVARSGDDILGWIGAIPMYDFAWELHPLVVHERARGLGIGKALVAALEDRLRAKGILTLYLGTDDDGDTPGTSVWGIDLFPDPLAHAANLTVISHPVSFYRSLGFAVCGVIPDANGLGRPDVLMAKRLRPAPTASLLPGQAPE